MRGKFVSYGAIALLIISLTSCAGYRHPGRSHSRRYCWTGGWSIDWWGNRCLGRRTSRGRCDWCGSRRSCWAAAVGAQAGAENQQRLISLHQAEWNRLADDWKNEPGQMKEIQRPAVLRHSVRRLSVWRPDEPRMEDRGLMTTVETFGECGL